MNSFYVQIYDSINFVLYYEVMFLTYFTSKLSMFTKSVVPLSIVNAGKCVTIIPKRNVLRDETERTNQNFQDRLDRALVYTSIGRWKIGRLRRKLVLSYLAISSTYQNTTICYSIVGYTSCQCIITFVTIFNNPY